MERRDFFAGTIMAQIVREYSRSEMPKTLNRYMREEHEDRMADWAWKLAEKLEERDPQAGSAEDRKRLMAERERLYGGGKP